MPKGIQPIYVPTKSHLGGSFFRWNDGRLEAYGQLWPAGFDQVAVEGTLYAKDAVRAKAQGAKPKHEHFISFLKLLVPEQHFAWHRWAYEGAELFTERWWTCIGAAGTGKSAMFGLFALGDWLADPANTVNVLVSTSIDSLKARIWKYVCQWHEVVDERYRVGHFRQANPLGLMYIADPTEANPQPQWQGAGILCVGFKAGESSESIKNHLGRHLPRNRITVDELQGVNPAVLDLWWNMGASGEFTFGGFGNPQSMFDPLADASVPEGHGPRLKAFDWLHQNMMDSGSRRKKTWKTEKGRCLMFDGLDSPALDDTRFAWLIGKEHIEAARKSGENSPQWYAFIRGIFPPSGGTNTLLTPKDIQENGADGRGIVWDGPWQEWLWGDLAHGGDDDAEIQRVRVGMSGKMPMIEFFERQVLKIDMKSGFISQQIARQVAQLAQQYGIPVSRIAIDATATQGAMIDAIEEKMKAQGIRRIHASGPASKRPVKFGWPQTCDEEYDNRAAEMAGNFREFVINGHCRGIDAVLAQQACSRCTYPKEESKGKMKLHEDKKAGNGGKSPNALDLVCVGCTALREYADIHPGMGKAAPQLAASDIHVAWRAKAEHVDIRRRGHRLRTLLQKY